MKLQHKPYRCLDRFGRTAFSALALLCSASLAQAALTVKYTFNDIAGTTVPNTAPGATINGTLVNGANGNVAPIVEDGGNVVVNAITYPLGNVVRFAPAGDGDDSGNAPYIQTNGSLSLWGITGSTQYTAMAWVKFNNQNGDNMVFGDLAGNRLHLGSRDSRYWSGHWGDDVEGTNIATDTGNWHHIAWTNNASNNQTIYRDGVLMTGAAGAGIGGGGVGGLENGDNLVVGTSGNGGSFNGSVDDVKVFNTLLTAAEIQAEMTSTLFIPSTDITVLSGAGSTVGNDFKATIVLKDGVGGGHQVVLPITNVTFDGANAASFSATKTGDTTTVVAQLAGPYIPGQHVYSVHVLGTDAGAFAYDLARNVTGPVLPPVASIPGSFGATSALPWGVREYTTTAPDGPTAVGIILGAVPSAFTDHETAVINFVDPQAAGNGGDFNNNVPFPGDTAADDNHVIVGKAKITLAAPGTYSFNLRTDDGCALKITGATCTAAFGAALDPSDSSMVLSTAVTSARVAYSFPAAGTYDVAFMSFDSGGGGSVEISWAEGAVTSADERQLPWALFGNTAHPSVPPTTSAWPTNLPGLAGVNGMWGIRTYSTEGYENCESLAATMAFLSKPEVISWTQSTPAQFITPAGWYVDSYNALSEDTLTTLDFVLPATPGTAQVTLKHRFNFEDGFWDGGVIQYSINGGPFLTLASAAFSQNPYNGIVIGTGSLLDQPAFVNSSNGAFITSVATIPGVVSGDELQIRLFSTWDECCGPTKSWEINSIKVTWGAATVYSTDFAAGNGGLVSTSTSGTSLWTYSPSTTLTRTGVVDTLAAELNYKDPTTNPGEVGVVLNSQPYPADTAADDNHVVTVAHSRITIATSAEYTFNHQGDDGFLLRVKAVSGANPVFRRVSGGGQRTMSASNEMFFPTGTGNTDTRGIMYLAAGQYDLDYAQWEGGGGFFYQLTMAQGAFIDNAGVNGTDNWVPVGHVANNLVLAQPTMESPWDVQTSLAGALVGSQRLDAVPAAIAGQPTIQWSVINFTDPETNGAGPGRFGADSPWQNNTGADDNNYAIHATGYLHIETTGLYQLGFDGDDGSDLILSGAGAGFISIVENATGAGVIEDFGGGTRNRLKTDVPTGQSRTTATIQLVGPSDYPIEVNFYEIGGGSWFEVYGSALGTGGVAITPAKANATLVLLKSDPSYPGGIPTVSPDNTSSPALSAQPTADLSLGLVSFSAGAGDAYSIAFPSAPGLAYAVEYSTDLVAWYRAGTVYGGPGASTTFNGNLTDLNPALPANAARVYWRVSGRY